MISRSKEEILRARAEAYAVAAKTIEESPSIQVVELTIASEHYGIETAKVREIFPLSEITFVPGTPAFILGIASLRGVPVAVMDLKKFFDLSVGGIADLHYLVVVSSNDMELAIAADKVIGIRQIQIADIQALPDSNATGIGGTFLRGVTVEGLIILNLPNILGDRRFITTMGTEMEKV